VIHKPATTKPIPAPPPIAETDSNRFDRILLRPEFKPLKAVFNELGKDSPTMVAALITTNCYQMFLGKLGYRVNVVRQIREQDCYARIGPAGGIRAVVPVQNALTYNTLVTLLNYDSTVTTTSNSVDYFDEQLAAFKVQMMNRSGDAP